VIQNNLGGFLELRGDALVAKAGFQQDAGRREEDLPMHGRPLPASRRRGNTLKSPSGWTP